MYTYVKITGTKSGTDIFRQGYALLSPYLITVINLKIAIFLKLAWPHTSLTVFSNFTDNTEKLFMNVRGMTDKLPI